MDLKLILVFCIMFVNASQSGNEDSAPSGQPDATTADDGTCSRGKCNNRNGVNMEQENKYKSDDNQEHSDDKGNDDANDENIKIGSEDEEPQKREIEYRLYEFPPLTRISPGEVGDVVDIELEEGKLYKRITRSVNPPIFEIPNYLSRMECNMIISSALDTGLEMSGVLGSDINEEKAQVEHISQMSRVSEQTWLSANTMPKLLWKRLINRLSNLTQLPVEHLEVSEQMQVVSYVRGGHYHAHVDSSDRETDQDLPCCFQTPECLEVDISTEQFEQCCRICRYVTVLYYLTDVEEGGETAFPLAGMSDDLLQEKLAVHEFQSWHDLSNYCHNASVIVKPKRGTAIMWYNHLRGEDGYLAEVDQRSHHGGCDIIKGNKWIANNWISGTTYKDRNKISMLY